MAAGTLPAIDPAWAAQIAQTTDCGAEAARGVLVRTLPLYGPGAQDAPLERVVGGEGLDARLFTDLSDLTADRLVTPTARVFVRTAAPRTLSVEPASWQVAIGDSSFTASALAQASVPQGAHLIECAGNSNPQHFGLMSAVEWDGVPLAQVLARAPRAAGATGVLVTGADPASSRTERSIPGASWILPLEDLERRAPFLATRMNGRPLTPDHGAPVRLVVPGWYGCAWIKWVTSVRWVGETEPSTPQMLEYAVRTHQDGRPALARDYAPPRIDTAAMPVRVEQRRVDGHTEYRVIGIVWGGEAPVDRLVLRIGSRDRGTIVPVCPRPMSAQTWALWTYDWRPTEPGYYDITLRAADPAVPTRRLDLSFYIRRVKVDEI